MNIKPSIYESLSSRQRIISMIDAIGRKDDNEIKRLKETCEKKRYEMRDAKYSDVIERLFQMSMAVESDLRGIVINFLDVDNTEIQSIYIQELSNIHAAWSELLESMGVNEESMLRASSPRHYWIDILLKDAPLHGEKRKTEILEEMKSYINL